MQDRLAPAARAALLEGALDRLRLGLILLDSSERPVFCNSEAMRLEASGDAFRIEPHGLTFRRKRDREGLRRLVTKALTMHVGANGHVVAGAMMLRRAAPGSALLAVVCPVAARSVAKDTAIAIFISDPDIASHDGVDVLQDLFRLSSTEARVALACCEGLRPDVIAGRLGLTTNTTRWYLKQVCAKVGVSGQMQLVRLLLKVPQIEARIGRA